MVYHIHEVIWMDENFIRDRITQLRLRKGVSEYQMSYDLGHSRGYVYNISSGKALPPMKEFLAICDYFELTPQQFFDESTQNPELIQKAISGMKQLNEDDLLMLLGFINRLLKKIERCIIVLQKLRRRCIKVAASPLSAVCQPQCWLLRHFDRGLA